MKLLDTLVRSVKYGYNNLEKTQRDDLIQGGTAELSACLPQEPFAAALTSLGRFGVITLGWHVGFCIGRVLFSDYIQFYGVIIDEADYFEYNGRLSRHHGGGDLPVDN